MKWEDCAIYDLKRYNSYKRSVENLEEKLEMLDMQLGQAAGKPRSKTAAHAAVR